MFEARPDALRIAAGRRSSPGVPPGQGEPCARRHQRSRKKGARTPDGVVYAGRPTLLGNPFMVARFGHRRAVRLHRLWLTGCLGALSLEKLGFCPVEIDALFRLRARVLDRLRQLRGIDLQCWCPLTGPCHVDMLLAVANA
jgi:hypothetical protein